MSILHKICLKNGLKKLISSLICLVMVFSTFPIHILNSAVCFAKGENINLVLDSPGKVREWLGGDLAKNKVAAADNINIMLGDDFYIYNDDCFKSSGQKAYFFDFTDPRFKGKTININGCGRKITIKNKDLLFLNIKDCTVNLNDVSLDGADFEKTDSQIKIQMPFVGQKSILNMNANSSILGCRAPSGAAIYADKNSEVNINDCSKIAGCSASIGGAIYADENAKINMCKNSSIAKCVAKNGGGAIYARYATINMNGISAIIGCEASGGGGAIYAYYSTVSMSNVSRISGCVNKIGSGGAICANNSTVNVKGDSRISNCKTQYGDGAAIYAYRSVVAMDASSGIEGCVAENGYGGAICLKNATTNMNEISKIDFCRAKDGGAIYAYGGTVNMNGDSSVSRCFCAFGGAINVFDLTMNCPNGNVFSNQGAKIPRSLLKTRNVRSIGMPRVEEDCQMDEIDDDDYDISDNVENVSPYKIANVSNISSFGVDLFENFSPQVQSYATNSAYGIYNCNYSGVNEKIDAGFYDEKAQDMQKYKVVFEVIGDAANLPEQVMWGEKGDEICVPQYVGYYLVDLKCGNLEINVDDGKIILDENIINRADKNNVITLIARWNINNYNINYYY